MKKLLGKEVGEAIEAELIQGIAEVRARGIEPGLAVVLVGENPESQTYVGRKVKTAERLGLHSHDRHLPADISQADLELVIQALNADPRIHGVLCQLPLPEHLDEGRITRLIDPAKDVDCFHPYNFGLLAQGTPRFLPCTPAGIMAMLAHYGIPISGKNVAVLGRSNIVGRPMSLLLSAKGTDATVTLCHSRTQNLPEVTSAADILIAAIGRPEFVGPDMVGEGATVIDVGMNRVPDSSKPRGYRLCGDVDFDAIAGKVAAMTPVPGGVGPLTVLMLMKNTLRAAQAALA